MSRFRSVSKVGLFLALMSGGSWAQSTDPSHPTPWTGYGINSHGVGRAVTYYYSVPVGAGDLQAHLRTQAVRETTATRLTFSQAGRPVGEASATAAAGAPADGNGHVPVRPGSVLMAVQLDPNVGDYSIWLDVPARTPFRMPRPEEHVNPEALKSVLVPPPIAASTWEMSGAGDGATRDYYYPVRVGPGDVNISVTSQARVFSTSVSLDVEDEAGVSLRRVGAIATSSPVTETGTFHSAAVQSLRVHIRVDGNCGAYSWSMQGPVEH